MGDGSRHLDLVIAVDDNVDESLANAFGGTYLIDSGAVTLDRKGEVRIICSETSNIYATLLGGLELKCK